MANTSTLYTAKLQYGGHVFRAVDVLPALARLRLLTAYAQWAGAPLSDSAAATITTETHQAGTFTRTDAPNTRELD